MISFQIFKPFNPTISKRILSVAYPIIIANLSRATMGIVDMIMVGKLGVHSIAAVGFGEIIVFTLIVAIGISLMTATQTITARRYGQGLFSRCSECLLNGQLLGLLLGTPFMILGYFYCGKFITLFINYLYFSNRRYVFKKYR